ncbi:rho GTPase-activating protein 15-like isoform X2 [Porites lutea]|uniref:rho GTPase-activating protein 15-like isoform X2 n=1 Tax=Porites lutea TaxID=51062 RepID=UPI003CC56EB4
MANGTVEALYPYSYEAGDGRVISFSAGDRFTLLNKTNGDWWQVRKGSEKPMYVPATYMKEITIPIYENIEFKITCPQNGEAVARTENGQSSERGDYKNESNGETAIHQDNELENHNRSVNIGTENNGEDTCYILDDTCPVSDDSNGVGSVLSNAKFLARSLEKSGARPGGSFSMTKPERPKSLSLPPGWVVVTDEASGRPCYMNSKTNETSWKPPRISRAKTPPPSPGWQTPPLGWRISRSSSTDELVYVNEYNDEEWVPSKDSEGRVYYYKLNGEDSRWELPEFHERSASVQSRESVSSGGEDSNWPAPPTPTIDTSINFFQEVEKQGVLNRKKLLEGGGKKVKKMSWTPTFVILFSSNLVFYKDQKAAAQKPGLPHGKPESTCVLQGASLEWAPTTTTKKKNAFQIRAVSGLVFLLQHDHQMEASNWFNAVAGVIKRLNDEEPFPVAGTVQYHHSQSIDNDDVLVEDPGSPTTLQPEERLTRTRSRRGVSERDDSKSGIKDRLKKLLTKRPPIEELERKGIIKESVFGCHIAHLCERQNTSVPVFVSQCISAIEKRGLSFDGLYRVCGNVSTVQKIRICIDQEEKIHLGEAPFDDVHALTGSLKLYFRELPEPLIPYDFFSGFVEAIKQSTRKSKLTAMRSLAVQMPKVNGETLKLLLRHLRKLMVQSEANRMNAQNLAIVWGPNLMWPRHDSGDIALNMVHQNQIIEFLLLEFDHVFK